MVVVYHKHYHNGSAVIVFVVDVVGLVGIADVVAVFQNSLLHHCQFYAANPRTY